MPAPSHSPILALGYSEAAMVFAQHASEISAILSIHGNREHAIQATVSHRLDLDFDDIDAHDPADPVARYHAIQQQRRDAENGLNRRAPTIQDAQAIIHFAQSIQTISGTLLCHCGGGISRAPAAALLCLATWTGPGNEKYCAGYLHKIRPGASPHPDLVRFADGILERNGALINAVYRGPA